MVNSGPYDSRTPRLYHYYAPINVIPGGGGTGGGGGGDFDKAFLPEGVAFNFMDSPQGADI